MSANVYVTAGKVHAAGVPRPPVPAIDTRVHLRNVRHNLSNLYAFSVNCLKSQPEPAKQRKHRDCQLEIHWTDQGRVADAVAEAMEDEMDRVEQSDSEDEDGFVSKGFPSSFPGTSSSSSSTPKPTTESTSPEGTSPERSTTEPFPDYYESCEGGRHLPNPADQERYEYAVFRTAQDVKQFRIMDARIACSPIYLPEYLQLLHGEAKTHVPSSTLAAEAIAQGETIYKVCKGVSPPPLLPPQGRPDDTSHEEIPNATNTPNPISPQPKRVVSPRSYFKWDPNEQPVPESTKVQRLEEMRTALCDPELRPEIKARFLDFAEIFIAMERMLFGDTELNCRDFLGADVLVEIDALTQSMVKYIGQLSQVISKEHCAVDRTRDQVRRLFQAENVPIYQRYVEIARVMIRNAKSYSSPDRALLMCTLRLFEALVYDDFLIVRQHRNLHDDDMNIYRVELCRIVVTIWSALGQIVIDYERWVDIIEDTHRRYVLPVSEQVPNAESIWDQERRLYEYEERLIRVTQIEKMQRDKNARMARMRMQTNRHARLLIQSRDFLHDLHGQVQRRREID